MLHTTSKLNLVSSLSLFSFFPRVFQWSGDESLLFLVHIFFFCMCASYCEYLKHLNVKTLWHVEEPFTIIFIFSSIEKGSRSFYYFLTTLINCCLTFTAFNKGRLLLDQTKKKEEDFLKPCFIFYQCCK